MPSNTIVFILADNLRYIFNNRKLQLYQQSIHGLDDYHDDQINANNSNGLN